MVNSERNCERAVLSGIDSCDEGICLPTSTPSVEHREFNVMQSILFDFFGTLVHYSSSRVAQGYQATHSLVREYGIDIDYGEFLNRWIRAHEDCDAEREASGREYRMVDVSKKFLAGLGAQEGSELVASRLWRSYITEWSSGIRYIAGVPEMVKDISEHFKIGVISNTQDEELVHDQLKKSGIAPYVDVVVTSVEHGIPKPHPSIFQLALDKLVCKASDALFVGDSYVHDYVGATNAGLKALLIAPPGESRAPLRDTIASVLDVSGHLSRVRIYEKASSNSQAF